MKNDEHGNWSRNRDYAVLPRVRKTPKIKCYELHNFVFCGETLQEGRKPMLKCGLAWSESEDDYLRICKGIKPGIMHFPTNTLSTYRRNHDGMESIHGTWC